jgi:hypothetical protein
VDLSTMGVNATWYEVASVLSQQLNITLAP